MQNRFPLGAVPLRVGQVERLGDEVVGRTAQAPTRAGDTSQRAGEVGPRRDEEREVEETGRAGRSRGRVRVGDELDERRAVDSERRDAVRDTERPQADRRLVELVETFETAHAQLDRAESCLGGQFTHRQTARARGSTS